LNLNLKDLFHRLSYGKEREGLIIKRWREGWKGLIGDNFSFTWSWCCKISSFKDFS
jgi:hypothetical protein